ncbi:unnamed protein product [Leuciscus chuanchicus]
MAAPRRIWTIEKEDKLAELCQEQRALYDVSCSVYRDRVVRDDILQQIAQELQLTGIVYALEDNTAAQGVEDSDVENEIDLSPGLEQSSCDTPCENDQPASGPPASGPPTSGFPLCRAKVQGSLLSPCPIVELMFLVHPVSEARWKVGI